MSDFSFLANRLTQLEKQLASYEAVQEVLHDTVREQGYAIRNATLILERLVDLLEPTPLKDVEPQEEV